jgi:selenophosphate synthetase-related protein
LGALTSHFPLPAGARVKAAFGEDCAVLDVPRLKDEYLLLGLDAIVPELLARSPRFAGYSSVLVNVLDIVAMAGQPIAAVDFLGSVGPGFEREVARGMAEASAHFGVPIVGGHLHPDDPAPSLAVAILGRVLKDRCTFSHTARAGDALLFAADLEGKRFRDYPMAWSPLRQKPRREVERRLSAVPAAAAAQLLHACKDASNPGVVGTFGMMLEASGLGGAVEVDSLPRPRGVNVEDWMLMYQGCGFVFASAPSDADRLCSVMASHGLTCARVGTADRTRRLAITRGRARASVFDFRKGGVTGIPPAK